MWSGFLQNSSNQYGGQMGSMRDPGDSLLTKEMQAAIESRLMQFKQTGVNDPSWEITFGPGYRY